MILYTPDPTISKTPRAANEGTIMKANAIINFRGL